MKKNLLALTMLVVSVLLAPVYAQDAAKVYNVQDVIDNAPQWVGQTITVKGKAQHVCSRSGKKIFLQTPDAKRTVRFNAGKDIAKFDMKSLGKEVTITGVVYEQKVTMEALEKQLAALKKAEAAKSEAEHCSSDAKAQGLDIKQTPSKRVELQIAKLKKQIEEGGNNYLSYYSVFKCNTYSF